MPQQRRWLLWSALAYLGVLAATATGLGLLYSAARSHLDEALGLRLQGVATSAMHLVDGDAIPTWSFDPEPGTDLIWLTSRLERLREDNDLAEVTLCDHGGFVIASASGRVERGAPNIFWDLDRPSVDLARVGVPSISRLYRAGDLYQKSAHAPIFDRDGRVAGVLTVEGNAGFFQTLAALRRGAWVTVAAVLTFLAVMGALLLGIHRSLERARTNLARQEQLATMGRMTAGIAHEIRNPLGIIRGSAQHLQRVLRDHGLDDEVAAFIPEEVDRLDRILSSYLAFGRDDDAPFAPVALPPLASRTARLLGDEFQARGLTLAVQPADPVEVLGDAPRLQQVLLNLLLNARDAMPAGGEVTVTIASTADGRRRLTVSPCWTRARAWAGTPAEKVFDPFWTTKDKGSGLGLAISRRIAHQHGGDLSLSSRDPGPGCDAILTLPRAPSAKE